MGGGWEKGDPVKGTAADGSRTEEKLLMGGVPHGEEHWDWERLEWRALGKRENVRPTKKFYSEDFSFH